MNACGIEREDLSRLLDGELDEAGAARVREHVAGCAACAAALDELGATRELLRSLPPPEPTADFERHLLEKIRGLEAAAVARPPLPASFAHRHPFVVAIASSVAAAVAVTALNAALLGRERDARDDGWSPRSPIAMGEGGEARLRPVIDGPTRERLQDHVDDTYSFVTEVALRSGADPERDLSLIEHDIEVSELPRETNELLSHVREASLPEAREEIEDYLVTTDGLIRVIRKSIELPQTDPHTRFIAIKEATRRSRIVDRLGQVQMLVGTPAAAVSVSARRPTAHPFEAPADEVSAYKVARRAWFDRDFDGAVSALQFIEREYLEGDLAEVAHFWIADAFQRTGRFEEARRHLRIVSPDFTGPGDPFAIFVARRAERARVTRPRADEAAMLELLGRLGEGLALDLDLGFDFETESEDFRFIAAPGARAPGDRVAVLRAFRGAPGGAATIVQTSPAGAMRIRRVVINGHAIDVAGDDPEVQVFFRDVEGHVLGLDGGGLPGQRVRIEVVTRPGDPARTERRAVFERPVPLPARLEDRVRSLRGRIPGLGELPDEVRELELVEERIH